MKRRQFLASLAVATLWPLRALPQTQKKTYRIGFLGSASPTPEVLRFTTEQLWQGLRELGWIEGKNIVIEQRWAEGRVERQPANAAELVRLKVDVLVVGVQAGDLDHSDRHGAGQRSCARRPDQGLRAARRQRNGRVL